MTGPVVAVLLSALMLLGPGGAATAQAATPSPTPSPSATVDTGIVEFTLSPSGSGVVPVGSALTVSVTIRNGTDLPVDGARVSLGVGAGAFPDRAALSAWLEATGPDALQGVAEVGAADLVSVSAHSVQTGVIQVTPDNPALAGRGPGVYPLVASYPTTSGTVTSTSALIIPATPTSATPIGVVVPLTAGPLSSGLLTTGQLTALTADDGALTAQLDAVAGTAAILAVDPAIPASIRVLGTAAPLRATQWLERLEALPNSRFALQFGDADVAAQLQTGRGEPAQPTSFSSYLQPANFAVSSSPAPDDATAAPTETPASSGPTSAPSPSADPVDPSAPVYPTTEELVAVGGRANVYWPATGTAGSSEVTALGAIAAADQASLTLVSSRSTAAGGTGSTVAAPGSTGDASVLVYDTDISAALGDASSRDDLTERGAALTAASAYLAFAATETGGRPLLVTIDRVESRSTLGLRAAITAATQATGVTAVDLGALTDAASQPVQLAQVVPDETRVAAASALFDSEQTLSRFATVLEDPTLLTGRERAELLQVLGNGWSPQPDAWQSALTAHRDETAKTLDSVGILPPGTINLISKGAGLPVWVRNDLPWPITVVLEASPNDLRLEVQPQVEVAAGASSNTSVKVPVEARVGNGEVTVDFQLRSTTYEPIGSPQTLVVNVHADWEGIGVVVLAVLAAAFVIFGLIRTVLRRRRARKASTDAPADVPADTGASADGASTDGPSADEDSR
ncbi:DUF6049 family protein [Microbacterium sp. P03]|uniref:DUF6049 family protein n=1 Tax=Microbacterium sp. P03 TaxID=3366946 RepID=UPI00374548ED